MDSGHVAGNPEFKYHDVFDLGEGEVAEPKERHHTGRVGGDEVKQRLVRSLIDFLTPIQDRRRHYQQSQVLDKIVREGSLVARQEGRLPLVSAKKAMGLDYFGSPEEE